MEKFDANFIDAKGKEKEKEVKNGGSSRQSCNLTGESPVMSIAHVGHVAIPQPGAGNQPGHAWCKRPVRLDKHRVITVGATWRPSKYESSNIKE